MSGRVNRQAYEKLIAEDIAWLKERAAGTGQTVPGCLEAGHIALVLESNVAFQYGIADKRAIVDPAKAGLKKLAEDLCSSFHEGAMDFDECTLDEQEAFARQAQSILHYGVGEYFFPPDRSA